MASPTPAPRYSQIERALRERIAFLAPGDPLPSDAMLCKEFGVSRMTARSAVQRLVEEGLVERLPGHGTFVARDGREPRAPIEPRLGEAAAILFRLADERQASVSQLAQAIRRPRKATAAVLDDLERLDLVEEGTQAGTYRLALAVLRLGSAVIARFDERQAALPVMEQLHQATQETVYLCVRRGDEAICIEYIEGLRIQSMALRLGGSLALHLGAAPRVLLAYQPREFWAGYVARGPLEALTPLSITTKDELIDSLESTRASGYVLSEGDVVLGIASIGAPIYDRTGRVCAALSVGGPEPTILGEHRAANVRRIVDGAAAISRTLGYAISRLDVG